MSEHELWNELGNLYFMSGIYNQAAYAYNRSIQLDQGFGRPYCNLALTYVKQGRYAEAVDLYQRSIELLADNTERAITWYRLGDVYRHLKDYRDAIMAYQQADVLDTNLSDECKESGQILYGGAEVPVAAPAPAELPVSLATSQAVEIPAPAPMEEAATHTSENQPAQPAPELAQDPAPVLVEATSETIVEPVQVAPEAAPAIEEPIAMPSDAVNQPAEAPMAAEPEAPLEAVTVTEMPVAEEATTPLETSRAVATQTGTPWDDEYVLENFEHETEVYLPDYQDEVLEQWLPLTEVDEASDQSAAQVEDVQQTETQIVAEEAPCYAELRYSDLVPAPVSPQRTRIEGATALATDVQVAVEEEAAPIFIIPQEDEAQQEMQPETALAADLLETHPRGEELDELEEEIDKFKHVVQTNPRNASAWDTLGTLYKSARRYRDAILAYQQAVSADPSKAPYHHHLGIIYAIEGREEDAMRAFQEVIEIDPNHSLANATLGGYYRKMGLEDLAQKHIGKAMKNFYNSENEYNRACLEALCGNIEQSIELLRVALQNKQTYVDWVLRDPDLDSIRRDPRFKQLISDYTA